MLQSRKQSMQIVEWIKIEVQRSHQQHRQAQAQIHVMVALSMSETSRGSLCGITTVSRRRGGNLDVFPPINDTRLSTRLGTSYSRFR